MAINIAIGGGPCTGKSTLAAALFAKLKELGLDYDLVPEESRTLKKEFGRCRSPFDRLYLWCQQERQELRSTATDGFITDSPLFQLYVQAIVHSKEPRYLLAVRELLRMCLDIRDRYQLVVIAADANEIPYKRDHSRSGHKQTARRKHKLITTFVEHFWEDKVLFVRGSVNRRVTTIVHKLHELRALHRKSQPPKR